MKHSILVLLAMVGLLIIESCSNNAQDDPQPVEDLVVNDFLRFIDENPASGEAIGTLDASTTTGTLEFTLISQSPDGALALDAVSGELTVDNASLFVFADNPVITAVVEVSNGTETKSLDVAININDPNGPTFNIWTGTTITFSKSDGADPALEANQDRITNNVWITRGNSGGQIFNIKVESSASKATSPADTEWARGTTANIQNLSFAPFRDAVNPKSVVGQDLVLHLITDDIYIDVVFTSWSQDKRGGFSYKRATE